MKNIRTHDATQQLLSAIAANGGMELSANGFATVQEERNNIGLNANDDVAKLYQPNMYLNSNGWEVVRATNGTPIYIERENGRYVQGSARYIPSDIYAEMANDVEELSVDDFEIQPYDKEKPQNLEAYQ